LIQEKVENWDWLEALNFLNLVHLLGLLAGLMIAVLDWSVE
jgi:hypothetical protein